MLDAGREDGDLGPPRRRRHPRLDLETRTLSVLPGTDDLDQPKCSRQGLLLAVRHPGTESARFWTYDPRTASRTDLGLPVTLAYPNFTRDGQSVIGCSGSPPGIYGFTLRERRIEKRADVGSIQTGSLLFGAYWLALDPGDAPIVMSDQSTYEIYALELEWP